MQVQAKKAVVLGLTFLDNIFYDLDRFPELGAEVFARGHALAIGGIAITALNLAKLGLPTALVTSLGSDLFGQFVREQLEESGLELVVVPAADGRTNQSVAIVCAGERGFLTILADQPGEDVLLERWLGRTPGSAGGGGARCDATAGAGESVGEGAGPNAGMGIGQGSHLHVGLNGIAAWRAAQKAKGLGMSVSVSISHPSIALIRQGVVPREELWAASDIIFMNLQEAEAITGRGGDEMMAELCAAGAKDGAVTAVTRGALGAWLAAGNEQLSCGALEVEAVDTTGAGDAFASGFLAGYLRGRPLRECLALGVVCGSRSTTAVGGVEGVPGSFSEAVELASTLEVVVKGRC